MTSRNLYIGTLLLLLSATACQDNDPKKEDVPEMITKVVLKFTPSSGPDIVTSATDPDGDGIQSIKMDGPIQLKTGTTYKMTIQLINGLAQPGTPAYDVTSEVGEEGDEHMFFFEFTNNTFSDPTGNGNVDSRNDPVNYTGGDDSKDSKGLPLGLTTTWTTYSDVPVTGSTLRILLKHQPGVKSATSTSADGETDLDITFTLNVGN